MDSFFEQESDDSESGQLVKTPGGKTPKGKQSLGDKSVSFQIPGKNTPNKTPKNENSVVKKRPTPGKPQSTLKKFKGLMQNNSAKKNSELADSSSANVNAEDHGIDDWLYCRQVMLDSNANDSEKSCPVAADCESDLKFPIEKRKPVCKMNNFQEALKKVVPSFVKEGFCMIPAVTWEDVIGLKDMKEKLQKEIIRPIKYRKVYENSYMQAAKGILLHGPKGCGKTLLANVIGNESTINFLSVEGHKLLSKCLVEGEGVVRQCFQRARYSSPCIIFFDEIDALCPERIGSNISAATERVVNVLLTEIDQRDRNEVIVIGATNRIEKIDSAMLRPGRLEKIIYIGLPTPDDRVDILKKLTKDKQKIADNVDFNVIGHDSRSNHFSGGDLAHLIREATENALEECITLFEKMSASPGDDYVVEVKLKHFEYAFSVVKPSN